MERDWSVKTIGECASSEPYSTQIGPFGKALMADQYVDSGVPVLRGVNVNRGRFHDDDFVFIDDDMADRLSKFESFPGDVLLVHKGTLGQIGLMPRRRRYPRYIMGNSMMRVRCDPRTLLPEYLYYWLSSADGQHYLFSRISQVGVPQLQTPLTTLRQAELPVPPLAEQRAIAHILGTLDNKIELNRRMNGTLEAMARTFFKSWFVDFDPVRAKAGGRDPGLPKSLADLFPARLVDSEFGEIPEGWGMGRFGDVVEQLRDQENPLSSPNALFHHFSIPAFDEGQTPSSAYGESIKSLKFRVPVGVVLLSKLNPDIERVWMVDVRRDERAVCSTEFLVLSARSPFTRTYVYCLARSPLFRQQIESLVTGTSKSHQRAQVDSILNLAVVVPPPPVIAVFDQSAERLMARTLECRRESHVVAGLRDALLPKLVSGELRVDSVARVEETVA